METKTLSVQGMSCEHCVKAVTQALGELHSLANINVNLKNACASFSYDPAQTSLAAIEAAIVDAGYEIAAD